MVKQNHKPRKVKKSVKSLDSVKHQACKALSKVVKTIKAFLIQKCVRKIAQYRETNSPNLPKEEEYLEKLKKLDHTRVGRTISETKIGRCLSHTSSSDDENTCPPDILKIIVEHQKVTEQIKQWNEKYDNVENENIAVQVAEAKKEKKQGGFLKRDFTTASFVESLQHEGEQQKELRLLAKQKEKEKKLQVHRLKKMSPYRREQEAALDMYRPAGDRVGDIVENIATQKAAMANRKNGQKVDTQDVDASQQNLVSRDTRSRTQGPHKGVAPAAQREDIPHAPAYAKKENRKDASKEKEEVLHPSWAAKKNSSLTGMISADKPQGKKIVFDD
jgi:hypothetical protein